MSALSILREKRNLTQEELAEKSGISVRTIQRIEAGTPPKGYTLKALSVALGVEEDDLKEDIIITTPEASDELSPVRLKLINLSSLPVAFLPGANILAPLLVMLIMKKYTPLSRQIVTVQIFLTTVSLIVFMLSVLMSKSLFTNGRRFVMIVMVLLVITNVFVILRNTAELDKRGKLYFRLNFSMI